MSAHDPRRARPHWGATSECTRCGQPIIWRGVWRNGSANAFCASYQSQYAQRHHSATAGTPPANSHESTELAERAPHPLFQAILEAHGAPKAKP